MRRMYSGLKIERPKGGLDKIELVGAEKAYAKNDQGFEPRIINDDYIKEIRSKVKERIFIEKDSEESKFTNSCWEIQRVTPF